MKLRSSNLVLAAVEGNSKTFWLKFYLFASTAANANEMMLLQSMSAWWLDKIFSPPRLEAHFQNQLDPHVCQKIIQSRLSLLKKASSHHFIHKLNFTLPLTEANKLCLCWTTPLRGVSSLRGGAIIWTHFDCNINTEQQEQTVPSTLLSKVPPVKGDIRQATAKSNSIYYIAMIPL